MITTIRLADELHKSLKQEAEKRGMTFNGYLVMVLWEQIQREERKEEQYVRQRKRNS